MTTKAFFKLCLVLIFLNTIVEKHTLNPEIRIFWDFYCLIGPWWVQIAAPKYLCQITHQWGLMHANEILRGSNTDAVIYVRVCVPILEQGYASIIFFLINRSRTRQISFDACHPRSKQFPAPAFDSIAIEQGTPNKHYWTEQYLFKHEKRQMNCLSPSVKRRATTMEVALCQNIYNPAIFLNRNNYLLKIFTKFTKYLQ